MKRKAGFTLVELMIVVGIVAILAAVGLLQFGDSIEKANLAATMGNMGAIRGAITIYYGGYAAMPDTLDITDPLFGKCMDKIPYVKAHRPVSNPPYGNEVEVGQAQPVSYGTGWYYNDKGWVYVNSIAKDIKGNIYSTY